MTKFTLHTIDTAPAEAKKLLEESEKGFGTIPNLHAVLAEAPGLLEGYKILHTLFQSSTFSAEELTVVWQTINVEHECHYCVPAHTMIANMMAVDPRITEALRNRAPLPDKQLQVLHETTLLLTRNRGHLTTVETQAFYDAGYNQRHLLEIILGLAQKVISNYVNHLAETPTDSRFEEFAWVSDSHQAK